MDVNRWKQIDDLLDAALEVSPEMRVNFVTLKAGDDHDLRDLVLELLKALGDTGHFLNHSAMHVAARARAMADDQTEVSAFAFINKKIGTYRVDGLLGAGGMGEVYLAFDEKLKRKVALKLLPSEYVTNDERVKRFELEARAVSMLNHPGIVTIYDVGNFEGVNYIATEFVEGKTLRDLIGGEFKLRNIVLNSIQICDALAAAHKEGIIHRDIKPENIMIRKDGYAKILDFGLAKLTDPGQQTLRDFAATTKGVIIGTPAYMSPAQISDESVDHRTDLWSCGVVLYEFLTGKNPFKGETRQETFQAILSKEITPPSMLNPDLPKEVDMILQKLLHKNRDRGYQSALELRADLKNLRREVESSPSLSPFSGSSSLFGRALTSRPWYVSAMIGVVLIAAIASMTYFIVGSSGRSYPGPDWLAAKRVQLTNQAGTEYYPSLSPDGKDVVYAAEENGRFHIFHQRIGGKRRTNLTPNSTGNDVQPAFSPDGNVIAFRSSRSPQGIYTIELSGENLRHISDEGHHPSWSPDGKEIVVSTFGRDQPSVRETSPQALYIIDVQTGARRKLIDGEATFPSWSPNGHRVAYWFHSGMFGRRDIATVPAGGGEPVVVAKDFAVSNWNPVWSPDGKFLYFVSSRAGSVNFWRVPINESTGEVLDEPEPVTTPSSFSRHLSFSRDGTRMAYVQTNNRANIQGIEFDLASLRTIGEPFWITEGDREVSRAELSPDGSQFVMRLIRRTQDDIATVSRDGREWRDVTNDEPFDRYVRWSPDGRRLAFYSDRDGGGQVWICNSDGTALTQYSFEPSPVSAGFPIWSPDGQRIIIHTDGVPNIYDISRPTSAQTPHRLARSDIAERMVVWDWSPDGKLLGGVLAKGDARHLGYFSLETNKFEIVVPDRNTTPAWLPDSRHMIYSTDDTIFIADVRTKSVRELFSNSSVVIRSPFVSRDGKLLYYTAANLESDIWLLDLSEEK